MELQEFLLIRDNDTLTKSYESESLIETAKILSNKYPGTSFEVVDKNGIFIWKGESAHDRVPNTDE